MNTVYARLRSARTDLDRMARRLRARNAPALTRMVRQTRPAERTKARTWGLLVAKLSTGSVSVATATGAVGAGVLKWAAMGGLTSALLLASVAAVKGPEAESPAPTQRVAATQPDPIVAPPSAAPRPQRPTVAKPTDATSPATADRVVDEEQSARARRPRPSAKPSLTDEVARVKKIRRAVARADRAPAQAAIDAYRREFGEGALRLEVDALSVELACRISADDARRRLRDFKRRRPDAHLVHRVEKTCAGQIGPQKPGDARTPSR